MGILCVNRDKINLDNGNFDKDDPESLLHVRLVTWRNRLALARR